MGIQIKDVTSFDPSGQEWHLPPPETSALAIELSDGSTLFIGERDGYPPLTIWRDSRKLATADAVVIE